MPQPARPAEARRRILAAMGADPTAMHFGYDLLKATHLYAGRLYITLDQMQRNGDVVAGWVDGPEPRRRWYKLTSEATP